MSSGARARRPRVAVVAPNWLGDAVMSLPAVAALGSVASVSVMAPRYTARVYWRAPGVEALWVDPPGGRVARVRARARGLRAGGASAALLLPPSFSSALAPWLALVRMRVGYACDGRRALLTDAVPAPARTGHLAESYRALARRLGAPEAGAVAVPRLYVADAERASVAERLARAGAPRDYVVVVPGAAYGPAKSWPRERYRELCARLARRVAVVVSGGARDRETCAFVAGGIPGVFNLAGETGLGEFFALAEGARVLVANDSGAPHVSASLGTPTVVLFGSTAPAWTAPLGSSVVVLQHVVHCNPCFRRTCPTQLECFNGIAVDAVEARALAYLAGASGAC